MQILFHKDFFTESLQDVSLKGQCQNLFDKCREKNIEGWILATSVPEIIQILQKENLVNVFKEWLDILTILPLTGNELRDGLKEADNYEFYLIKQAISSFRLKAVLTAHPDTLKTNGIAAVGCSNFEEDISKYLSPVNSVPLVNVPATHHDLWNDVEDQMAGVVRSGMFILGPKVAELEEQVANYCQTKYAVGVSSGTDALLISLMAADVGPGDEVITTPFTFFATIGSIIRTGAHPVLVDIDPVTFNIDPKKLEEKITPKTRAIIPIHLYGQCADMDPILELANSHGISVIEDAAQAIGSEYKFKRAGSFGDYGCFSFFPTKNLGGFGDGGIVTVSKDENYEKLKLLRVHGSKPKYYHKLVGGNFRLDALQAGVLCAKLPRLEKWTQRRRENSANYNKLILENGLADKVQSPQEIFPRHIYNQYVVRVGENRDSIREFLGQNKIGSEVYYPIPLHLQECFQSLGYKDGDFPVSEKAAKETLALPISHEVTLDQQVYVIEKMKQFFSKNH
jgi:dTDP-4-amino-4,6-dideoxygalactose transaminase